MHNEEQLIFGVFFSDWGAFGVAVEIDLKIFSGTAQANPPWLEKAMMHPAKAMLRVQGNQRCIGFMLGPRHKQVASSKFGILMLIMILGYIYLAGVFLATWGFAHLKIHLWRISVVNLEWGLRKVGDKSPFFNVNVMIIQVCQSLQFVQLIFPRIPQWEKPPSIN